jgi:hypothetical protein
MVKPIDGDPTDNNGQEKKLKPELGEREVNVASLGDTMLTVLFKAFEEQDLEDLRNVNLKRAYDYLQECPDLYEDYAILSNGNPDFEITERKPNKRFEDQDLRGGRHPGCYCRIGLEGNLSVILNSWGGVRDPRGELRDNSANFTKGNIHSDRTDRIASDPEDYTFALINQEGDANLSLTFVVNRNSGRFNIHAMSFKEGDTIPEVNLEEPMRFVDEGLAKMLSEQRDKVIEELLFNS